MLITFAIVQFILAIALSWLNFGPKFEGEAKFRALLSKAIVVLLFLNLSLVIYSFMIGIRVEIWIPSTALLVGAIALSSFGKKSAKLIIFGAVMLPVIIVFFSLMINGAAPITQDEGLWSGLSYRIVSDQGWNATLYSESAGVPIYYQPLPVTSYLQAAISIVTGMDIFYLVSPLTVLLIALVSSLCIYSLVKNLLQKQRTSFAVLGPAFLCAAPYLLSVGFIPQTLAIAFFLISVSVLTIQTPMKTVYKECLIIVVLISIVGIITHVTYPIFLLFTIMALFFAYNKIANRIFEANLLKSVLILVAFFTLTYWAYTLILDSLVINYGKSWIQSLVDLSTGSVAPFESGRRIWYDIGPTNLAYSFALLPALAGAYIFIETIQSLTSLTKMERVLQNIWRNNLFTLGATGLFLLAMAFITRASPGVGFTRYLGPSYILLIPPSIGIIDRIASKKRLLGIIILVIMISASSFFAIQDPSISPDVHKIIGLADKRSWNVAKTLAQYQSPTLNYIMDQRVGIPFWALAIKFAPEPSGIGINETLTSGSLIVLNFDVYGEVWANRFLSENALQSIANGTYGVVYTDGLYTMYVAD